MNFVVPIELHETNTLLIIGFFSWSALKPPQTFFGLIFTGRTDLPPKGIKATEPPPHHKGHGKTLHPTLTDQLNSGSYPLSLASSLFVGHIPEGGSGPPFFKQRSVHETNTMKTVWMGFLRGAIRDPQGRAPTSSLKLTPGFPIWTACIRSKRLAHRRGITPLSAALVTTQPLGRNQLRVAST